MASAKDLKLVYSNADYDAIPGGDLPDEAAVQLGLSNRRELRRLQDFLALNGGLSVLPVSFISFIFLSY